MNLVVPFVKRKHFGERSFSYAAPREWNNLELSIGKSESLESFKKKLKPIFLKLHINKTCIDFWLAVVTYIYYYGIILHLVSDQLHFDLYLRYFIDYLCFILYVYFCDSIWLFTYITFILRYL